MGRYLTGGRLPWASLLVGLFLSFQHIRLTAIGLRHVQEAFGNFGVGSGPRHAFSLSRLFPKKFGFFHHHTPQCKCVGTYLRATQMLSPKGRTNIAPPMTGRSRMS